MELFLKAAEKGYPQAQIAIGEMYQQGFGVDKSEMRAKMWYKKAEKQGVNLQQIRQMQQMQQMQQNN